MARYMYVFSIISVFLFQCNEPESSEKDKKKPPTANEMEMTTEDLVFKAVESLPEFKEADDQIKMMTNGEQSVSIILEEPNEDRKEYYLKIGYNKETWFEPYYNFYVDPETFEVTIEDMIYGDIVSMETWRKRQEFR